MAISSIDRPDALDVIASGDSRDRCIAKAEYSEDDDGTARPGYTAHVTACAKRIHGAATHHCRGRRDGRAMMLEKR